MTRKYTSKIGNERRVQMLEYLQQQEKLIVPVSLREIGEACSISSSSVVNYYLKKLEKQGKVKRHAGKIRFIELVKDEAVPQPQDQ